MRVLPTRGPAPFCLRPHRRPLRRQAARAELRTAKGTRYMPESLIVKQNIGEGSFGVVHEVRGTPELGMLACCPQSAAFLKPTSACPGSQGAEGRTAYPLPWQASQGPAVERCHPPQRLLQRSRPAGRAEPPQGRAAHHHEARQGSRAGAARGLRGSAGGPAAFAQRAPGPAAARAYPAAAARPACRPAPQGAAQIHEMEHLLNVYASQAASKSVADFLGYCEVDETRGKLTRGLWLVRAPRCAAHRAVARAAQPWPEA